jgi:hypothetical protein
MLQSVLSYLWPSGDSRWAKLYRGAVLAIIGALLTYLSAEITQIDFGPWTPAVVAFWSTVANGVRQWVNKLAEDGGPAQ